MRVLFSFFIKNHFTLLFLVLQIISFFLIVRYNHTQRAAYLNSSSYTSGILNTKVSNVSAYFSLSKENERLIKENTNLRNQFLKNYKLRKIPTKGILDTIYIQNFRILSAQLVQSSVYKTRNFLTVNIGKIQGVKEGSGVISSAGIVGVIKTVSNNYSVVLPVINSDFKVSCRLGASQYYGSLIWNNYNYRKAKLLDIPLHVSVNPGDTLFTTGFSSIFPTGELVGFVDHVKKIPGENFYDISINLAVDFKKLKEIYVIDNLLKPELDSLNIIMND